MERLLDWWTQTVTHVGPAGAAIAVALVIVVVAILMIAVLSAPLLRHVPDESAPPPRASRRRTRRLVEARILRELNADLDRRSATKGGHGH